MTVPFRTYVEKVMAAEWGAGAPVAALRVGAVAVKQFAWYYAIYWRGGRDAAGRCYDVRDSSIDQVYDPSRRVAASHLAAVAATWRVSLRKGERFFLTGYRPGTGVCGANLDGWKLYQRDAINCVHRHGDLAEGLARRFFSYVSWITPGAGDYTGDGRGDLAVVSAAPDTGETTATIHTSDVPYRAAAAAGDLAGSVLTTVPPDRLLGRAAGDVNGDGVADLVQLVRADDGVALEVMKASAAGFLPAARWWSDASDPAELGDGVYRLVVTDFTGDGVADAGVLRMRAGGIAMPPADPSLPPTDPPTPPPDPPSTSVFVAASTGSAFAAVKRTWTTEADLSTSEFRAGDLNGDGLGDLVVLSPLPPAVPADPTVPVVPGGTALRVALSRAEPVAHGAQDVGNGGRAPDCAARPGWRSEPRRPRRPDRRAANGRGRHPDRRLSQPGHRGDLLAPLFHGGPAPAVLRHELQHRGHIRRRAGRPLRPGQPGRGRGGQQPGDCGLAAPLGRSHVLRGPLVQ